MARRRGETASSSGESAGGSAVEGATPSNDSSGPAAAAEVPFEHLSKFQKFQMFAAVMRQPQNRQTLMRIVVFTLCMAVIPVSSFYASRNFFAGRGMTVPDSNSYAGFVAVAVTNVLAVAFIAIAFTWPEHPNEDAASGESQQQQQPQQQPVVTASETKKKR